MLASRTMECLRKRKAIPVLSFVVVVALGIVFEPLRSSVFLLLLAIVMGWLISLPLWFILRSKPSLRTSAYANRRIRWTMIGMVSLFVVPTLFVLYTYLGSYATVVFYSVAIVDPAPIENYAPQSTSPYGIVQRHGNLMTRELWLRQVAFPPLRNDCYSSDEVCGVVDDMTQVAYGHPYPSWSEYLMTIGISLVLSFPGTLFAWFHTRPPKDESRAKQPMRG